MVNRLCIYRWVALLRHGPFTITSKFARAKMYYDHRRKHTFWSILVRQVLKQKVCYSIRFEPKHIKCVRLGMNEKVISSQSPILGKQ